MDYIYRGDKLTRPTLKNQPCAAVRKVDGKCIRGKNGSMLVVFENGDKHAIIGRRLKKLNSLDSE